MPHLVEGVCRLIGVGDDGSSDGVISLVRPDLVDAVVQEAFLAANHARQGKQEHALRLQGCRRPSACHRLLYSEDSV